MPRKIYNRSSLLLENNSVEGSGQENECHFSRPRAGSLWKLHANSSWSSSPVLIQCTETPCSSLIQGFCVSFGHAQRQRAVTYRYRGCMENVLQIERGLFYKLPVSPLSERNLFFSQHITLFESRFMTTALLVMG